MASMESRQQHPVNFCSNNPALPQWPSQQMALHSSLAGDALQLPWASSGWQSHNNQVAEQPRLPSNAFQGNQQSHTSAFGVLPILTQPSGSQHSVLQSPGQTQLPPGLQLPLHVQQWLAVLANDSQQGIASQHTPQQHAISAQTSARVPSADAVNAATQLQEDVRQLRAELCDVKSKFAETQACPSVGPLPDRLCFTRNPTSCSVH